MHSDKKYSTRSATAVIVANMIGTGVFASLGYQLLDIQSGFVLLLLWAVGGLTALFGALSYAELGSALPRSGGEYHFLSKIYHPAAGFVTGWVSTTIGFAAPTAMVAILFGGYFSSVFRSLNETILAAGLIIVLTAIHITNHRQSGGFHQIMTLVKLILITLFCVAGFTAEPIKGIKFVPHQEDLSIILSSSFAVSLIYVNYAYMGWNSATYISSELDNPQKSLPRILLSGTLLVAILYVLINAVFLYVAPIEEMKGVKEIGFIAAKYIFGDSGSVIFSICLSIVLISTVSAMTIAGPRAFQSIGQDYSLFKILAKTNNNNIPVYAILLQSILSLIFIFTSSFQSILIFAGFTLGLSNFATVLGVFVLRYKQPKLIRPYKTWLYPLTPLLYLLLMGWTLWHITIEKPSEALMSLVVIVAGILMYLASIIIKPGKN